MGLGITNYMIWVDFAHEGIEYGQYEKVLSLCRVWELGERAVYAQHFFGQHIVRPAFASLLIFLPQKVNLW